MKRMLIGTLIFCSSTLISMEWPDYFPKRRNAISAAGVLAMQYYEDENVTAYIERDGELRNAWFDKKTESYGASELISQGRVSVDSPERCSQIYKALQEKSNSLQ